MAIAAMSWLAISPVAAGAQGNVMKEARVTQVVKDVKLLEAQAAPREFYDAIKTQAEQQKIPVLSEERFNLLIRYYDPVKR